MKYSLAEKLHRVKVKDLLHIAAFLVAFPLSFIVRLWEKDLWIICDNQMEARDNGYFLFEYIRKNHPECNVVYAIDKKSPDYQRVKHLGRIIQYGSLAHWIYYLAASKNISSQKGGKPNAAVCFVLEVYGILKKKTYFLQHGITKDNAPFLHYKNTKFKLFVCGAVPEYQYVAEKFGYPEGAVQNLGFCRFDNLFDTSGEKRQLLVMPTWRSWIGHPTSDSYAVEDISDFTHTVYYQAWNDFLSSKRLHELLEKHQITLVFYPHRDMQQFLSHFSGVSSHIQFAKWPEYDVQTLLKESKVLITDYSSIAMDFAYQKKPLLYYQFDYEMFRNNHYPEGYFSYEENGFGPVCYQCENLLDELENLIHNQFHLEDPYQTRVQGFFLENDFCNCERNYQAIKDL